MQTGSVTCRIGDDANGIATDIHASRIDALVVPCWIEPPYSGGQVRRNLISWLEAEDSIILRYTIVNGVDGLNECLHARR